MAGIDQFYDRLATTYAQNPALDTAARLKLDLIEREVSPGDAVLDIGCANGLHLRHGARSGAWLVGIDRSAGMLDEAATGGREPGAAKPVLVRGDAMVLPFADSSFDVVYSLSTLVLLPSMTSAFAEVSRVLREGGTCILDIAGRYNLAHLAWRWWYARQGHHDYAVTSLRGALQQMRTAALETTSVHALGVADQWRYVPGIRRSRGLNNLFHGDELLDRDYRVSNRRVLRHFASRWYVVARKEATPRE